MPSSLKSCGILAKHVSTVSCQSPLTRNSHNHWHKLTSLPPTPGCEAFMEFIRDGHVIGFERITSPINNNPNQTKTIRLVREHNPTLASRLPGPAWVIMQTEMLLDMDIMRTLPGGFLTLPSEA